MAAATASGIPPHHPSPPPDDPLAPAASSPSNPAALARFEFEAGKSNDGTKVLMIEWEEDEPTRAAKGDWHLSWVGLDCTLLVGDAAADGVRRVYYLLPENALVPPTITLTFAPSDESVAQREYTTTPLPAIFPPELGATARTAGKKGVLHTMWAKKRLAALTQEIETESRDNVEGIGLQIAIQEKEWIENNFGVNSKPAALKLPESPLVTGSGPLSPQSPRSPGGGRLLEKMRGLKLNTHERAGSEEKSRGDAFNPLSPEETDVAVSSFSTFKGPLANTPSGPAPQQQQQQQPPPPQPHRRIIAQGPPSSIVAAQDQEGTVSLDSIAAFAARKETGPITETDDGLFALPMSPRSPETKTSPFSFKVEDTQQYRELVDQTKP